MLLLGQVVASAAAARGRHPPGGIAPGAHPRVEIQDRGWRGLGRVFEQLCCLAEGYRKRSVRIAHYGDSILADDRLTSAVRQLLQARFGDAGPGFLLVRGASRSYRRAGVRLWADRFWRRASVLGRWPKNHHFGYAGVLNWSVVSGARVYLTPRREGGVGGRVSRLWVYYQQRRRGGWIRLLSGRRELGRVSTRGPVRREAVGSISFAETGKRLVLEHGGGGSLRLFGLALERRGAGVVLDGLGMVSTAFHTLLREPADHWLRQLRLRRVNLVIFQYGANASDMRGLKERWYKGVVRKTLARLRAARPRISCLVVGPLDRGYRWRRSMRSRAAIRRICRWQRQVALASGCAFFDSLAAQGGRGSARRWYRSRPRLMWPDLTHVTPAGSRVAGRMLGEALLRAFDRFKRRRGPTACPAVLRAHELLHRRARWPQLELAAPGRR